MFIRVGALASVFAHRPVVSKKLLTFADWSNAMLSLRVNVSRPVLYPAERLIRLLNAS
jgi:hypothetical protein